MLQRDNLFPDFGLLSKIPLAWIFTLLGKDVLPGREGDVGRSAADNRNFIEAVMWIGRNGTGWRSLPEAYGKWATVHKRFIR